MSGERFTDEAIRRRLRRAGWAIEDAFLGWTQDAEPCDDYRARLLAEDDDGNWLVPAAPRNGEPWWQGRWTWWKPTHWPVWIRSRRRRTYVMVERSSDTPCEVTR